MSKYELKIKDTTYTLPKENLKLLAMSKGIFANNDEEIIERFKQNGVEISEVEDEI